MSENTGVLVYDPNNSGGEWWLSAEDCEALEAAGWIVTWAQKSDAAIFDVTIRRYGPALLEPIERTPGLEWLDAEAGTVAKAGFASAREGIAEWERITGERATDLGCECCGPPHAFEWYPDGLGDGKPCVYISPEAEGVMDYGEEP